VVLGKGGDADPESGIEFLFRCPGCGYTRFSSYKDGIIVDERQWDGSDLFTINGYPMYFLVTEKVRDLVVAEGLTNVSFVPAKDLVWSRGVVRPEEVYR